MKLLLVIVKLIILKFKVPDEIGLKIVANIVMVGAITKITNVISKDAAIKAIEDSVPKGTEEKNIKAFEAGFNLVE